MAETFPFDVRATRLGIVSGLAFGRDEGGLNISSRHVEPYWRGTFTTPPLTREDRIEALALLDDWVDMNRRVDFIHPSHRFPIGYSEDDWPMSGDATLDSVTDLRNIVVDGLTAGLVLRAGSRLSLIQAATGEVCYRKIVTTIASTTALNQTINIGPRLPPGVFAAGATVRFEDPPVRMMVVPESWDPDETVEDVELVFEMIETLR